MNLDDLQKLLSDIRQWGCDITIILSRVKNHPDYAGRDKAYIEACIQQWDRINGVLPKTTEPRRY